MKIVVIGSGLIGVTSAYLLRLRGHDVTVLDRREGAGQEASFANGALLTPSMAEPWNAPGAWRDLLTSVGHNNGAMQLRLHALPALARWGVMFLRNSKSAKFQRNMLINLRMALYSRDCMRTLRDRTQIEYGRSARGSLRVFRSSAALDQASLVASERVAWGLNPRRLSTAEAVELEPALMPIADQLVGAIHHEADEVGDAHRFCMALADCARLCGVEFRFRTEVRSIDIRAGRVTAAVSERERFGADCFIIAAGSYSSILLRRTGVYLPVQPVKGYSITFDKPMHKASLTIPIVDDNLHVAVVPLGGAIRIAGTAEFAGYDCSIDPDRVRYLMTLLHGILPQERFDPKAARSWCGLRPVSADGVPIICSSPVPNLYVNTGHGHLGWTMAAGSAQLLTDLISGDPPSVDSALFDLARFAAA